jgi:branched-chain amino acid transport system permease protein
MVAREFLKSLGVSLWFMALTFPLVAVRVNTIENTIQWRWANLVIVGVGAFVLSGVWRWALARRENTLANTASSMGNRPARIWDSPVFARVFGAALLVVFMGIPWLVSAYQTNILISFFLYVMLGIGLNIVVGVAGLLFLGYAAFYAIGAYAYALLNHYFGWGFWTVLPIGGVLAAVAGVLLAFPVLRLRGDYLAIVTLGFGEIVRLVLENWSDLTGGPSGISNIDRPGLFGQEMTVAGTNIYIYYIVLVGALLTFVVAERLKDSRVGRALQALREDEVACQAMGIDRVTVKLMAFGLGTAWAGFAGVIFAAKTTFINPASFTFFESAIILSIVVLGGMGSNWGVILGAAFLVLLPEYMRAFSEYRMILFAAAMVLMMVFRPQGIIPARSKQYRIVDPELELSGE